MQSDNKNLHLFTHEWIKYIVNNNPNEIIQLIHPIVNLDGTPMLCQCNPQFKLTEETLTPPEANNVSLDILHKISNEAPLKDFLQQFLFPLVPIEVLKSQAEVLHQLSGEYQIESVLPWRSFDMI